MSVLMDGGRALVTGASGFIGGRLCQRLIEGGAEVHAVSRHAVPQRSDRLRWWRTDLAEADAVRSLVRSVRPDVVYHLASHVSGAREVAAVLPTFRDNLASTVNLLVGLTQTGCARCVLAGSLEEPDAADAAAVPCSPYAAAKAASSLYGRMFFELYGLPVVTMRLFMVYGPGQRDTRKLVPYTITSFLDGRIPSFSSGRRPVDWIYVDDVVDGLIAAGLDDGPAGYTADLGSGVLITVREVVLEIARLMGIGDDIAFGGVPDRPLERVRRADVAHTRGLLGWAPRVSLTEGLQRTIEYYREDAAQRLAARSSA